MVSSSETGKAVFASATLSRAIENPSAALRALPLEHARLLDILRLRSGHAIFSYTSAMLSGHLENSLEVTIDLRLKTDKTKRTVSSSGFFLKSIGKKKMYREPFGCAQGIAFATRELLDTNFLVPRKFTRSDMITKNSPATSTCCQFE